MKNGLWLDISRTRLGRAGLFSTLLLFATVTVASSTSDLNADWGNGSGTQNPNGQWSLRCGTGLLTLHSWLSSESAWLWDWSGSTVPSFAFETLTKWNDCLPGDIVMQGDNSASAPHANIRWTAPGNGIINISGRTWDAYGTRAGAWTLFVGGSQVAGGLIAAGSKRTSTGVTFAENILPGQSITNLPVLAGTQIIFNQDFGTVGVGITISYEEAPPIIITSFHGNGKLTWTNSDTNLFYRVEWSPSLTAPDPWHSDYSSLTDIRSSDATVTSSVPMFYRVCGSSNQLVYASPVPKTGQTNSYVSHDDGWYSTNVGIAWLSPRFTVGTGVSSNCVTDRLTGLMWLKNPDTATRSWDDAITYCEGLGGADGRGGYSDWRLANIRELLSMIDFGQHDPALPSDHPFTGIQSAQYYWTSSTLAGYVEHAWIVLLHYGTAISDFKTHPYYYVWPVRGGQ